VAAMPPAETREFQITVIPQNEQNQAFKSFEKTSTATNERTLSKKGCEPHLSVQREGDRITSIHIQCSCGQTIDLTCLYDPPAKDPPVKATPAKDPAAKDPPAKDPPVKEPLAKDLFALDPPAKAAPAKDPSAKVSSAKAKQK
jgi:hypothetical protein